jgi:hypothetical protein
MEASVDPSSRGPDWMPITPERGSFLHADSHAEELRLPFFWRDSGPINAWPPPTPPLLASSFVLPGPGPDWQAEIKARNTAEREENERHIAQLRERDRERQERELKEGKEAIAREVAERNRRNRWPY